MATLGNCAALLVSTCKAAFLRLCLFIMPINYFLNRSQSDLEADLVSAQNDLAAAKQRTAVNTPHTGVQFQTEESITRRIRRILYALNQIDPTTYPDADTIPVTMAEVRFGPGKRQN